MNIAQHETVKYFSLESVLGMGDLIQFLKSIQRLYTVLMCWTRQLRAWLKHIMISQCKISQCLLRASKHHDWVYLLPPEIRQEEDIVVLIVVCVNFGLIIIYFSTPTLRNWRQLGVQPVSTVHDESDGLIQYEWQLYGYDHTHSGCVNFILCWNPQNSYLKWFCRLFSAIS